MPFDYSDLDATAVELIADFGRNVVLRRRPATPPDPNEPWKPEAVATIAGADYATVKAVQSEWSTAQRQLESVEENDQLWLIAATGAPADLGTDWELVDGARVLQVVQATVVQPGGTNLLWMLHVRA